MNKKNFYESEKCINLILICASIALGALFVYINLAQYKCGLNADVASEGMLAKVTWLSKEWIPDSWYSSTETRVFSPTNVAALFYGVTKDICLSMGMGSIVGMLFILLGAYKLCQELEISNTQKLWFLLLILLLPNNKNLIELMYLFAGYYAFHIGLYFYVMAYYLKILKGDLIKIHQLLFLWICHFLLGMQGMRVILMITGPLLATEVLRILYLLYVKSKMTRKDRLSVAFIISSNVVAFLGGRMPTSVGYPLSRNIRKAPQKFFDIVLPDFLNTFDWNNISLIEKIIFLGMIILVLSYVICILIKGIKKQELQGSEWVLINFFISVFLTTSALTFTTVDSSSRYFIVIFFAMAMGIVMVWKRNNKFIKGGIIAAVTIILIGNCWRVYYPLITDKGYEDDQYTQIGDYLIVEGYENAYTNFDHANTITVMNDGRIQVSAVASLSNMEICKWLSDKMWYVPNVPMESKTAYIVSDYRMKEFDEFLQEHLDTVEFKTKIGEFNIYGSDYNYSKLTD